MQECLALAGELPGELSHAAIECAGDLDQTCVAADPYCVEGVTENIARRVEAARLFAQDFADSIAPNQVRTRDVHRRLL